MAYTEYFDVPEEEEPTEPMPTPPVEAELPEPEEKKDDIIEVLEDVIIEGRELEGYNREQIIALIKQKKLEEKEQLRAKKAEAKEKEMSEEQKKRIRILTAESISPKDRINEFDLPEERERKQKKLDAWKDYEEARAKYEKDRFDRTHKNLPTSIKPPKPLKEMTLDERTKYFKKVGWVKDSGRPKEVE